MDRFISCTLRDKNRGERPFGADRRAVFIDITDILSLVS